MELLNIGVCSSGEFSRLDGPAKFAALKRFVQFLESCCAGGRKNGYRFNNSMVESTEMPWAVDLLIRFSVIKKSKEKQIVPW